MGNIFGGGCKRLHHTLKVGVVCRKDALILVVLSRLWGGGVADRGTDKGADFLA